MSAIVRSWAGVLGLIWWVGVPWAAGEENDMVLERAGDARQTLTLETPKKMAVRPEGPTPAPSSFLQSLGGLLFVAGAAGAGLLWVRHFKGRSGGLAAGKPGLAVIERLAIGGRRELLLVRAGAQDLVLANSQQEIKLIAMLSQPPTVPGATAPKGSFADLVRHEEDAEEDQTMPSAITGSLDWPGNSQRV